jgi:hypothetical protein
MRNDGVGLELEAGPSGHRPNMTMASLRATAIRALWKPIFFGTRSPPVLERAERLGGRHQHGCSMDEMGPGEPVAHLADRTAYEAFTGLVYAWGGHGHRRPAATRAPCLIREPLLNQPLARGLSRVWTGRGSSGPARRRQARHPSVLHPRHQAYPGGGPPFTFQSLVKQAIIDSDYLALEEPKGRPGQQIS